MPLTQAQMEKMLEEAPRREVGDVDFECPNCENMLHEKIYEDAFEVDEDGTLFYDGALATSVCKCGASLLVAWQPDGQAELYWLNKKEMQDSQRGASE